MVRKTKENADKTRTSLLDAAQALFTKQGVSRTTLNDIAKAADLTRGAVYWHFENKDAIIIALWERGAGPLSEEVALSMQCLAGDNVAAEFRALVLHVVKRIIEDPSIGQAMHVVMHCVEITETQTPIREFLNARRKHMYETFYSGLANVKTVGGLKSELSLDIITGGLMSYLYGLIEHHLEPGGFLNLSRDYEALIDIYLQGILNVECIDVQSIKGA